MQLSELSTSEKVIGIKQSLRVIDEERAVKAFIADDAEDRIKLPLLEKCAAKGVEVVHIPSMKQLGHACGIDVGSAAAVIIR